MKIKSLFDVIDKVENLPRETMPKKVPKLEKKNGKIVWGSRERKCTL